MIEDAVRQCLARLTDFDGRTSREQYQRFVNAVSGPIVLLIVFFAVGGHAIFFGPPKAGSAGSEIRTMVVATLLLAAIAFALTAAASVRRLHDVGKSGWWMALLALGGLLPGLILMVFLRRPGDPHANRWGPPPEDRPDDGGFGAQAARADARFAVLLAERARKPSAPAPGPPRRTFGRRR